MSVREGNPLNASRCLRALWAMLIVLSASTAWGQRAQFTTPIPQPAPTYPAYTQPAPGAVLDGTIQPVDPNWDPYADPTLQAPTLVPPQGNIYLQPDGNFGQRERLVQQVRMEATYLHGDGGDELGVTDVETSVTIAYPLVYGVAPLLLTPGFAFHFWDGPQAAAFPGADLPGQTYSAYLDFGWRPQITPRLSADLGVRPGVYSDFEFFNSDSFRIKARALGIYNATPQHQIVAGVLYLDRQDVKLLPAGGVIWTPTDATRFEILFPRPKFAQRMTTIGNTEWWWFVAGEYGGDSWSVERAAGGEDFFDYNDLRVSAGFEWTTLSGYRGLVEVGYVFDREVIYKSGSPPFIEPDDTFMVRGGLTF